MDRLNGGKRRPVSTTLQFCNLLVSLSYVCNRRCAIPSAPRAGLPPSINATGGQGRDCIFVDRLRSSDEQTVGCVERTSRNRIFTLRSSPPTEPDGSFQTYGTLTSTHVFRTLPLSVFDRIASPGGPHGHHGNGHRPTGYPGPPNQSTRHRKGNRFRARDHVNFRGHL